MGNFKPGTPGVKPGCAVTVLLGGPLVVVATVGAAMGHCASDTGCWPGWALIVGAMMIALTCGLAIGVIVNLSQRD
jgi:hypothetical protein